MRHFRVIINELLGKMSSLMFWDKVPLCYNCTVVFSVSSSVMGIGS